MHPKSSKKKTQNCYPIDSLLKSRQQKSSQLAEEEDSLLHDVWTHESTPDPWLWMRLGQNLKPFSFLFWPGWYTFSLVCLSKGLCTQSWNTKQCWGAFLHVPYLFLMRWKVMCGFEAWVNTQLLAVISPISLWCQTWFWRLISAEGSYGVSVIRSHNFGRLLTSKRCWPPTSYSWYLSSTFDDNLNRPHKHNRCSQLWAAAGCSDQISL